MRPICRTCYSPLLARSRHPECVECLRVPRYLCSPAGAIAAVLRRAVSEPLRAPALALRPSQQSRQRKLLAVWETSRRARFRNECPRCSTPRHCGSPSSQWLRGVGRRHRAGISHLSHAEGHPVTKAYPVEPQSVDESTWCYFEKKGLCVVRQLRDAQGVLKQSDMFYLPWRLILKAADVRGPRKPRARNRGAYSPNSTKEKS